MQGTPEDFPKGIKEGTDNNTSEIPDEEVSVMSALVF